MTIRHAAATAVLLLLAACAPPAVTPPLDVPTSGTAAPELRQTWHGADVDYRLSAAIATEDLPVTADSAFPALTRAYRSLGIEVKFADAGTRTVGNLQLYPHGGIHGTRVSEYLDCGTVVSGAPAADIYAVRVSLRSQVSPNGAASRVHTLVEATARSMDGTSTSPVPCASRGRLEQVINNAVLMSLQ